VCYKIDSVAEQAKLVGTATFAVDFDYSFREGLDSLLMVLEALRVQCICCDLPSFLGGYLGVEMGTLKTLGSFVMRLEIRPLGKSRNHQPPDQEMKLEAGSVSSMGGFENPWGIGEVVAGEPFPLKT
jgi:hypothetical protein